MKKYIPVLKKSTLFASVNDKEIETMLSCLNASIKTYKKGEYVFFQGDQIKQISVLVEGSLYVQRDDYWGNRSIISHIGAGDMFGEAYLARECGEILSDVVAQEDSTVIFFDANCIITTCSAACHFHATVTQNLFFAISEKNRALVQKLGHMSKRTTREKLISYLSDEAKKNKSSSFSIPFNRQQLADYLSVDRSAMSNELCKMRDEGLLSFKKNCFWLK